MKLEPLYSLGNVRGLVFQIRYAWTGWPSSSGLPPRPSAEFWQALDKAWEADGLRHLEDAWANDAIQITFSARPEVSPVMCAARAKGRLQHAFRLSGNAVKFSRKVALRTVGDTKRLDVEKYIRLQIDNEHFADSRFAAQLRDFAVINRDVQLEHPTQTNSGRYWYNLHLVLVTANRLPARDLRTLQTLRDGSLRIAAARGHAIRELSVMPDHLHFALRGNIGNSPSEIALQFLNNLAFLLDRSRIFNMVSMSVHSASMTWVRSGARSSANSHSCRARWRA